jgi:serine/threonine protein kinase
MSAAVTRPDVLGLAGSTVEQIRFDACIDVGGFGVVYRGLHTVRNEPIAIKCLRLPRDDADARLSIISRFRADSQRMTDLAAGNSDIVRWISSGELFAPATGERLVYIVYEWLDGRLLVADLEERKTRGQGGRPLREALDLLESAAHALRHAHDKGIVHRAFEPRNLMLARAPHGGFRLKVLDFGVAEVLASVKDDLAPHSGQTRMTGDGVYACSPQYGAPEQFSQQAGQVGPWTDVYSLTLVLYEVLRGERVRNVKSFSEGLAYSLSPKTGSPRASSLGIQIPPAIEDLLARAVSIKPNDRPANMGVLWTQLRELYRQSVPPVRDEQALAATAYDGTVADAMQRVRARTTPKPDLKPQPNLPAPPSEAGPFTGTMLMDGGGLRQLAHGGGPQSSVVVHEKQEEPQGSTAPLAMPVSPSAVTMGVQAMASPLAASFGPGVRSPVAHPAPGSIPPSILASTAGPNNNNAQLQQQQQQLQPPQQQQNQNPNRPASSPQGPSLLQPPPPSQIPQQQQQQQQHPSVAPRVPSIAPQPPPPQQPINLLPGAQPSRGSGLIIAILVALVLAVAGAAAVLWWYRGRTPPS